MALSPTAYRFTVKDYHRMAEADIFDPDDRVELIDGEVVRMAPIGSRHAACVKRPVGRRAVGRGESLAPGAFPDLVVQVTDIVG